MRPREGLSRVGRRRFGRAALLVGCLAALIAVAARPQAAARAQGRAAVTGLDGSQRAVFTKYCLTCHNENLKRRGTVPIAFEALDLSNVTISPDVWEKVVLKMRAGLMPPAGSPRPWTPSRRATPSPSSAR